MKKGYTLIELIVVLSIMAIFSSMVVINIVKVKERLEYIEFKNLEAEVKSLLSFGKAYCRKNKVPGQIIIGSDRKTIKFIVTDRYSAITKVINLGNDIEVGSNFKISENLKQDANNISDEGFIKSAGTITITNGNKTKSIDITISVGSDIIRSPIKNDEEEGDITEWKKVAL